MSTRCDIDISVRERLNKPQQRARTFHYQSKHYINLQMHIDPLSLKPIEMIALKKTNSNTANIKCKRS